MFLKVGKCFIHNVLPALGVQHVITGIEKCRDAADFLEGIVHFFPRYAEFRCCMLYAENGEFGLSSVLVGHLFGVVFRLQRYELFSGWQDFFPVGGLSVGVGTWRGPSIDEPRKKRVGLRCWFSVCCESAISGCRSIFASLFSRGGAACLTVGSMPLIHSDI